MLHAALHLNKHRGKKDKLHSLLNKMDQDRSGTISELEFVKNCLKNKSLLFPTVRYQLDLRGRILSHPFWAQRDGMANKLLPDITHIRHKWHHLHSSAPAELSSSSLSSAMATSVKDTEDKSNRRRSNSK
jgi:hypothetical protein